jgi:hypothetical protein
LSHALSGDHRESIKAASHIGGLGRDEDPYCRRPGQHDASTVAMRRFRTSGSNAGPTRIVRPRDSSTSARNSTEISQREKMYLAGRIPNIERRVFVETRLTAYRCLRFPSQPVTIARLPPSPLDRRRRFCRFRLHASAGIGFFGGTGPTVSRQFPLIERQDVLRRERRIIDANVVDLALEEPHGVRRSNGTHAKGSALVCHCK